MPPRFTASDSSASCRRTDTWPNSLPSTCSPLVGTCDLSCPAPLRLFRLRLTRFSRFATFVLKSQVFEDLCVVCRELFFRERLSGGAVTDFEVAQVALNGYVSQQLRAFAQ